MPAELSLKFGATDEVSPALKSMAAEVENLKKRIEESESTIKRMAADLDAAAQNAKKTNEQVSSLGERFGKLKGPISQASQLANGLGTAFGGAASKATGLINGIVGGLATGNPGYVAVAATVGIVSVLISKFNEAREAAEKARQAQIDEQIATAKTVADAIAKADEEIANLKAKLGRGDDADTRAQLAAAADSERNAIETVGAAEEKLAAARARRVESQKAGFQGSVAAAEEAFRVASEEAIQAGLALDRIKENNALLAQRIELLRTLRVEANAPTGGAGAKVPKGPKGEKGPNNDPKEVGDTLIFDIPEMEMEEQGRAQVRAYYKGWRDEEEKLAQDRKARAREFAKEQAAAAAEATSERLEAREQMQAAGLAAGFAYLDAMGKAIKGDGKGALRAGISVIAGILGIGVTAVTGNPLAGAAASSGFSSLANSALRGGGDVLEVSIPKARRGIAFLDMDSDGKVVEGHAGEVMLNAQAVARNGGIDRVGRQNNPFEPPMDDGGGGGTVNLYLSTLVPTDAAAAVRQSIEPGVIANLTNHQSGMLEMRLRATAAVPRHE